MKVIGGRFQIICVFLWICCKFVIQSKISFLGSKWWQNVGQICHLLKKLYLANFTLAKSIDIWLLFLNSMEWPAISRLFQNIRNFLRNRHFWEILQKNMKNQKSVFQVQKLWRILIIFFLQKFHRKVNFFTVLSFLSKLYFLRSPYDSTTSNI